ncbi:MAG: hypothetical protein IK083_08390 [Abditibacteriota bacterium]|nr:hypothetical protein [Abditibacteriota bacterium]
MVTDEIYHWYEYQVAAGSDDKSMNEMAAGSIDGILALTAVRMYQIVNEEKPSRWLAVLKERAKPYDWYSIPEVAEFTRRAIKANKRQIEKEGAGEESWT